MPDRTPEQWRNILLVELAARQPTLATRFAYYDGDHPLPRAPRAAREAYARFLRQSRSNWVQLVVDAVAERLQVVGFRFGKDESGDADAWAIWQANGFDADGELSQSDALTGGVSYVSVWPDESNPVGVSIAPEHPLQTIVAFDPRRRRRRLASAKVWVEFDRWMCWIATPEESVIYSAAAGGVLDAGAAVLPGSWEIVDEAPNPIGEVPVIELRPWPRTRPLLPGEIPGRSEMDGVIDIQNRINTTTFDRMVASAYASFRQRWATGLEVPNRRDPQTGEEIVDSSGLPIPVSPFDVAVDRLWTAEDPGVKFGEFGESELTGYIKASTADIEQLAAITRTPPHYLLGSIVNASGDALKAAETGLVSKVRRRAAHIGEGWEDVMRLAFTAQGDARAVDVGAEVIWADFETRSEGERVDALTKMASLGVPRPVLWQRWGASPQEIARWRAMAADEALMAAVAAAPMPGEPAPVPVPA